MKSKKISLRVIVTSEDGEVLEQASITYPDFDLDKRIDEGGNARKLAAGGREADGVYQSALRIAFHRAREEYRRGR